MLQLQGEGGERNLLRHRQYCHSGEVGGLVPCIPLTAWGVKGQTASWAHVYTVTNLSFNITFKQTATSVGYASGKHTHL